tara:strand:+ start:19640 stop:20764 length:1125 start_codon:yes stop_codon:yes gene_type:complete
LFIGLFETSVGGEDSGLTTEDSRPLFWVQVLKSGKVPDREIEITPEHIKTAALQYKSHLEENPSNYRRFDYLHNGAKRVSSVEDRIASGWIHGLESRNENKELWALVDWTDKAKQRIKDREFRYVSSEIIFQDTGSASFVGATLTNDPAILNLNGLFEEVNKMKGYDEKLDEKMDDKKEELAKEEGHASKDEVIELRKLREVLGLSPEWSVLDILKHLKKMAEPKMEASSLEASVNTDQVILERSQFEELQAFQAELKTMKAERAFEVALQSHQILPSKKDIFLKLYNQDPAVADALLYEAGKFEALTKSLGITGEASPTYSSEGAPTVNEFGAASEKMAQWFEAGKSETDFEESHPAAYSVYKRAQTLGLKRG